MQNDTYQEHRLALERQAEEHHRDNEREVICAAFWSRLHTWKMSSCPPHKERDVDVNGSRCDSHSLPLRDGERRMNLARRQGDYVAVHGAVDSGAATT